MTPYYISISFSDVPEDEMSDLVLKLTKIRQEYSLTIFKDAPEESDNGV